MDQDNWIAVVVVLLLVIVFGYGSFVSSDTPAVPTSFDECVAAGGQIMESFPEQCSLNGRTFVNPDQQVPVSNDNFVPPPAGY